MIFSDYSPQGIIYHDNCDDGYTARWVVERQFPDLEMVTMADNYTQDERGFDHFLQFANLDVIIVDFSYDIASLKRLAEVARTVVILDHHKSAQANLADLPGLDVGPPVPNGKFPANVRAHFDMEASGAMMAWTMFNGEDAAPDLVRFVEDRDLWRFQYEETKAVTAVVRSYERTMYHWDCLHVALRDINSVLHIGKTLLRKNNLIVEAICKTAQSEIYENQDIPTVVCPYEFVSDCGHLLLDQNPTAPFVACIVYSYGHRTVSLRSRPDRADVSEIAVRYGGGGHACAAGFRIAQKSRHLPKT